MHNKHTKTISTQKQSTDDEMPKEAVKGNRCRFVGGTHAGKTGWYDTANPKTPRMTYVIVSEDGGNLTTRVRSEFVQDYNEPACFAEAALYQHPDLIHAMNKLCKGLAECHLDEYNQSVINATFKAKLQRAIIRNTGPSARYRYVEYHGDGSVTL